MLERLLSQFTSELAIDLGTANTRVAMIGEGLFLDEPSVVAVGKETGRILSGGAAVGRLAQQLAGKTPDSIEVVSPLEEGVIADYSLCEAMLRHFFHKIRPRAFTLLSRVLVATPGDITPVQRRAVYGVIHRAGGRHVYLMEKAKAAAIGAELPIAEPGANLVLDIGEGTTEAAVVSFGDIAAARSVRQAGRAMADAIIEYAKLNYSLRIGRATAQRLLHEIGSAAMLDEERSAEMHGLDTVGGLPRQAMITSEEVREALADPLDAIVQAAYETIDRLSPDLASDLMQRGLVVCGGGANLRRIDVFLRERLGMPVRVAEEPSRATVRGLERCLKHFDRWRAFLASSDG